MYSNVNNVHITLPAVASVATITSSVVAHFINEADAIINAKLSKKYTVPFSATPPLVESLSTNIAIYHLLSRRAEAMVNDSWKASYKEAKEMLDDIADGKISLVTSSGDVIAQRTDTLEIWSNTMGYNPTFHEGGNLDTIIDPNKMDDILDDRDLQ